MRKTLLTVVWGLLMATLISVLAFVAGASMLRHIYVNGNKLPEPIKRAVLGLSEIPSLLKMAAVEIRTSISGDPLPLLIPRSQAVKPDWKHQFPDPTDTGYLLLSAVTPEDKQSVVQLIRIADGAVLAKWKPDWKAIHAQEKYHRWGSNSSLHSYRAFHPLLLADGSIIFNTGSSLVRQSLCKSSPDWVLSYPYHHSVELSESGNSVWVPSVTEQFSTDNAQLRQTLRDDALAEISLDGSIIQNLSFSEILTRNGMTAHLLGTTGFNINTDPIHINQITPATTDSPYWKRGDLLVSARHTSTVYLYRPSTRKIIWHQQGPWLNQHSVHFYKNNSIVLFGNDVYGGQLPNQFVQSDGHNHIYQYDFQANKTTHVLEKAIGATRPQTLTEGRTLLLEDMSLFIEETNNARLLKINANGQIAWSYLNHYNDKSLGTLSWSRYLHSNQLAKTTRAHQLERQLPCGNRPLEPKG